MMKKFFLRLILIYKKSDSSLVTKGSLSCIYHPTCSTYMFLSISRFGILKGVRLGTSRILRCRGSKYDGGYDPVANIQ